MGRVLIAALAASAAVLVLSVAWGTTGGATGSARLAATLRGAASSAATPAASAALAVPVDVDRILARPLLSPTRRPAPVAAAVSSGPAGLPRLTGVIISGQSKTAIFAGGGAAKPVSVGEGGQVGGYMVQAIVGRQATVLGPDGLHVVTPTFDDAAPPPAPIVPQPNLLDAIRQNAVSVNIPGLPPQLPQPLPQPPR